MKMLVVWGSRANCADPDSLLAYIGYVVEATEAAREDMSAGATDRTDELLHPDGFGTRAEPSDIDEVFPPQKERRGAHVWEGSVEYEEVSSPPLDVWERAVVLDRGGTLARQEFLATVEGTWSRMTDEEARAFQEGRLLWPEHAP